MSPLTGPSSPSPDPWSSTRQVEMAKAAKRFRVRFLLGTFVALGALSVIFLNRFHIWEMVRYYQTPEPERSQRKNFADQMDALQQQGQYGAMRVAAAGWRKTHPADPNGYATEGFAAYYLGDLKGSIAAWEKAASMDSLIQESAVAWIDASHEVQANWPGPLPVLKLEGSDAESAVQQWQKKADALLQSKDYEGIEKTANSLLQSQQALPDGRLLALLFFDGLGNSEPNWALRIAQLKTWNTTRPNSSLAKLALALCWVNGAWDARGNGTSKTISSDMRQDMNDNLASAKPFITDSKLQSSPFFATVFGPYAQLSRIRGAAYNSAMDKAFASFPNDPTPVFHRASHLLPRWYGRRGDSEVATANNADPLGGTQGDILYARTIWYLERVYGFKNIWLETRASWPRVLRGFNALLQKNPRSLSTANMAFILAMDAEDYPTARRILKTYLGGRVEREYWRNTGYFAACRMTVLRGH